MAAKEDIKDGLSFKTPIESAGKGRIGKSYAISKKNIENGTVNLLFEGEGCVFAGENYAPPSAIMKIEILELVK